MKLRASTFLAYCILTCAGDTNASSSVDSSFLSFLVKQAARCQNRYDTDIRELNITLTSKIAKQNDDLATMEKTVVGLTTKVAGLTTRLQTEIAAKKRALQEVRKFCRGECGYLSHHPDIDGGGWKLVRRVSPKDNRWHPATDGLRGTQAYGTFVDQPTYQGTFSRRFDWNRVQDFLFTTGDRNQWLVASRDQVNGADYDSAQRLVKMSSTMRYAHYCTFHYISINKHSPLVTIKNTGVANWGNGQIIYVGETYNGLNPPSDRNGANVFVRYR